MPRDEKEAAPPSPLEGEGWGEGDIGRWKGVSQRHATAPLGGCQGSGSVTTFALLLSLKINQIEDIFQVCNRL